MSRGIWLIDRRSEICRQVDDEFSMYNQIVV